MNPGIIVTAYRSPRWYYIFDMDRAYFEDSNGIDYEYAVLLATNDPETAPKIGKYRSVCGTPAPLNTKDWQTWLTNYIAEHLEEYL